MDILNTLELKWKIYETGEMFDLSKDPEEKPLQIVM